jgi:MFS family permease
MVMRFGARPLVLAGLTLLGAGLVLFTRAPVDGDYVEHVLPVMVLFGAGAGVCFPALVGVAMSGATPSDAGLASGLVNTSAQVGGALGLAVLATLSASRTEALTAGGTPEAEALVGGYHLAFWIGAVLVALALVVALVVLRPAAAPAAAPAEAAIVAEPEVACAGAA